MKRQYIFLVLIFAILYIMYLILSYKYREYRINSHIEYLWNLKTEIETSIKDAEEIINYKTTKAYKNKILKDEQGLKNKAEHVVYLTSEEKYQKFTKVPAEGEEVKKSFEEVLTNQQKLIKEMNNVEKWMYFLFKKSS